MNESSHEFDERKAAVSLIGTIRVDTDEIAFYAFRANNGKLVSSSKVPMRNEEVSIREYREQDPFKIVEGVNKCIDDIVAYGKVFGAPIVGVSVVNQRGSVMAWDRLSGIPLSNVILWSDGRTKKSVEDCERTKGKFKFQKISGLPFGTCFSAPKIKWMIKNNDNVKAAIKQNTCYFGTIDSWLVWILTGGTKGGVFVTDITNAAYTSLMNIVTLKWDKKLLNFFGVPERCLAKIKTTSNLYGNISIGPLAGVPITSVMGNRQADLVANNGFRRGMTTAILDDSGSVFHITGEIIKFSNNGLLTTIASNFDSKPSYALEGSIAHVGSALKSTMKIFHVTETECSAKTPADEEQSIVYHAPAYNGLYAPNWEPGALTVYGGSDEFTTQDYLLKSSMDSVCYQVMDIVNAINEDTDVRIEKLRVNGYVTNQKYTMQLLSDMLGSKVDVILYDSMTGFGGAMTAGYSTDLNVCNIYCIPEFEIKSYTPKMTNNEQKTRFLFWKKIRSRSCGLKKSKNILQHYEFVILIPASVLLITMGYFFLRNNSQY